MRHIALLMSALCALSSSGQAQSAAKPPASAVKSALDKPTLEQYVRHLYGAFSPDIQFKISDPKPTELKGFQEVTVTASRGEASQEETFYISSDGRKIVRGMVLDVNESPFQSELAKIKTDLQPSFGTPGAPVVIVIYSDFQCSFCKEEAKVIRQQIPATFPKDVRVYFKDYPLEQIHPWAKPAAIAGRCVFRSKPTAFWDFHDWIFEQQAEITTENLKPKVLEFAKTKGIEPIGFGSCIDSKATEAEVNRSMAEARSIGINSTPTLFINGRRLVGQVGWDQLKMIIDHEVQYAKNNGGGEKCCEVKLPNPLNP